MKGIFQIVFIIVFIAGAIFGILVFSGAIKIGEDSTTTGGTVVLWGTVKAGSMVKIVDEFNKSKTGYFIKYEEKSPDSFDQNLLEALASGVGPDLFFLPDNLAFHYSNKIFPIPFSSYPLATFKETFAGAGEVFLTNNGILAFPITIDPMMMYYNRNILDSNAITFPPKTWEELSAMVPVITKKDNTNKIIKPAVALGYYSNVVHAKDILTTMFMQTGNPIVVNKNGNLRSALGASGTYDLGSILQYYSSFADSTKTVYSWNKSFSNSQDAFSREDLAFYFAPASELRSLTNRNPNQNLGVAPVPQLTNSNNKITSSRVTGVAISSASKNLTTAFVVASKIATTDFASKLAVTLEIPPARRDLLLVKPSDAYGPTFYNSALYAKSYLDPSPKGTEDIFRTMIDSVLSNNATAINAVTNASSRLDILLLK